MTGVPEFVVPRQLPLAVRDFTGRADHVAALDALLSGNGPDSVSDAVVISALDGAAGIGKTSLAVHWAHLVQDRFPDGTLHVNLRGYGPGDPAGPGEVLDGFLLALGTPPGDLPQGIEAQAGLYRSLLARRRILIVLDNANSADQVRPLLPASPGCMAIVTSRDSLTGLVVTESATRITLDLLSFGEALQLVTGIIGAERAAAEPVAVAELIRLCARLPLALRIAASRVGADGRTTVTDVVSELLDDRDRIDALSTAGDDRAAVRAVFDSSYQRLTAEQASLFRRLGLHPGPDLSLHAAMALGGLDVRNARRLLGGLASAHLLEPSAGNRYRFHDLLRAYALEQATVVDSAEDRDDALKALLDWYVHTAHACDVVLFSGHLRLLSPAAMPVPKPPFDDQGGAMAWIEAERFNCLAALRHAATNGLHQVVISLAEGLRFLLLLGRHDEWLESGLAGLDSARKTGDDAAEIRLLLITSEAFTLLNRWVEALPDLERAMALSIELGDEYNQASVLNGVGLTHNEREDFDKAVTSFSEALRMIPKGVRMEGVIEGNLGLAYAGLRQYRLAFAHCERGLALRRRVGDLTGEVGAMNAFAKLLQDIGDHGKAIEMCRTAIARARAIRAPLSIAHPSYTLATSLHETGKVREAIECWTEAAVLFARYGNEQRAAQARERIKEATSPAASSARSAIDSTSRYS
ncbi:tetratricopeptide repeat protein [Amycolatopsis sp. WAC 04182]|uniref:ATP-binding protein n=1 Tax=Amycolatopsis sp. WAC 04182 TaxID=2203198 RepID=UPI001315998B|nr:tetratricopeptide repeat protein [Amycolatopsis sp. WAC 04182]